MAKIIADQEGWDRLIRDEMAVMVAYGLCESRLAENTLSGLIERIDQERYELLTPDGLRRVHEVLEAGAKATDDSVEVCIDVASAVEYLQWYDSVPHYLVEAYEGYYTDEVANDMTIKLDEPADMMRWVYNRIRNDNPREHLRVFLHWNGIINWDERILRVLGL